jgi:ABC-2 type transport system ATP-binding protein
MSAAPAIQVRELSRRFGAFTAVDSVSFEVASGEIFGYLGANGAGKSTTIRLLCGLLRPSSGAALVVGHDVQREPERVKRAIGYMSQRFSLYPDLGVRENLEFFGGAFGLRGRPFAARIAELLGQMDLGARADEPTGSLPGGMRQRLALACAMLHAPRLLFLDEPTAGVDPASRRSFWGLIRTLAASGTTIFVTTHHMDEAEYCDRVGLMVDGRLAALDTPAELKRRHVPGRLVRVRGLGSEAAQALASEVGVLAVEPFGTGHHVRLAEDSLDLDGLARRLDALGSPGASLEEVEPGLEDVFLAVVGESGRRPEGSVGGDRS